MSTIVAYTNKNHSIIAADRQITGSDNLRRLQTKIVTRGTGIAAAASGSLGPLVWDWLHQRLAEADASILSASLRCAWNESIARGERERHFDDAGEAAYKGGQILLANRIGLFYFWGNGQFDILAPESYTAIGSGAELALGCLTTLDRQSQPDASMGWRERLKIAIEVAAEYDIYTSPESDVVSVVIA